MDVNNTDYEYTDIVDISNVEEQLNDIALSDELVERAGRFVDVIVRKIIKSIKIN